MDTRRGHADADTVGIGRRSAVLMAVLSMLAVLVPAPASADDPAPADGPAATGDGDAVLITGSLRDEPRNLAGLDDLMLFQQRNPDELWVTDGTSAGTRLLLGADELDGGEVQ